MKPQIGYVEVLDVDPTYLQKTSKHFWVGVISGLSPSIPVKRNKTNSFTRVDVYFYKDRLVFRMNLINDCCYFYIPKDEIRFIEGGL